MFKRHQINPNTTNNRALTMSVFVVPVYTSEVNEQEEAEVTNQQVVLGRSFLKFSVSIFTLLGAKTLKN